MKLRILAIVALALVVGACLRFSNLGRGELSADEAASWAAAEAPTLAVVVRRELRLQVGKLPIHDVMLHEWMGAFGESVAAMRSLSAALGTLAILAMFFAAQETLRTSPGDGSFSADEVTMAAALAALVFAVNLVTIKYAREARMYSLLPLLGMLQVGLFLRSLRTVRFVELALLAFATAALVATNFLGALLPASEVVWLCVRPAVAGSRPRAARQWLEATQPGWPAIAAMVAAALSLAPLLPAALLKGEKAASTGGMRWLKMPAPWEPWAFFNKATGTFAFPVLAALAAWAVWRGWRREARGAIGFALIWMWMPPIALVLLSYLWRPVFLERYIVYAFPPFFLLAALGIVELPSARMRALAAALVVALALGHVWQHSRKPRDVLWREAAGVALSNLQPGQTMTVVPAYAINVVRYYLAPAQRSRVVRYRTPVADDAAIVLLSDRGVARETSAQVRARFPKRLAAFRGVTVRAR